MSEATAAQIRAHLATIRAAWANTADPMNIGHGTASGDPTAHPRSRGAH